MGYILHLFLAEEEGFEPPCLLGKRFSRPPRYDRFDIPAYNINTAVFFSILSVFLKTLVYDNTFFRCCQEIVEKFLKFFSKNY